MNVLSTRVEPEFAARVELYCKENGISPSSLLKSLLLEELDNKEPITTYYQEINSKFTETNRNLQTIGAMLAAMAEQQLILETYLEIVSANVLGQQYRGRTMPADIRTFVENMPGKMKTNRHTMEKLEKLLDDFNRSQEAAEREDQK
jgi:hypothetical protein